LGKLGDRFGRVKMMAAGLFVAGVFSLLLPTVSSLIWLVGLITLLAVGWATFEPAKVALVADLSGRETIGMGYGLYELAGGLGAALGPLLGGWLYDVVGQAVPFYLNGVVLLASVFLVMVCFKEEPSRTG
jgi:MFS family permease